MQNKIKSQNNLALALHIPCTVNNLIKTIQFHYASTGSINQNEIIAASLLCF